jgi:type VI secretion system secreted protein VgrG
MNLPGPTHLLEAAVAPSQLAAWFSKFISQKRLLTLETPLGEDILLVESFTGHEALSELFEYRIACLSEDVHIELKRLIGQEVTLRILAHDDEHRVVHGYVTECAQVGSDGGMARYELVVRPWLWFLTQRRDAWVFQEKTVVQIAEEIFADYPQAHYKLDLRGSYPLRSTCVQYRETDFDFLARILAEEGIAFSFACKVERNEEPQDAQTDVNKGAKSAQARHVLVLTDDPSCLVENPQNAQDGFIRYHRSEATETADAILDFNGARNLNAQQGSRVSLLSWDYQRAAPVQVELNTVAHNGSVSHLSVEDARRVLEQYDVPGAYYAADQEALARYAVLRLEALECRNKAFQGHSSVRTLAPLQWFQLQDHPLHDEDEPEQKQFAVIQVEHAGRNNLPEAFKQALEQLLPGRAPDHDSDESFTYRNRFTVIRRNIPWRPSFEQANHPKPTALGPQTALVVGPPGEEIYTDRLNRVKVQFHWQRDENAPNNEAAYAWVRVSHDSADSNWGAVFVPRIGQEVVVEYLEGDIDRPLITGRSYNGANAPAWYAAEGYSGNGEGAQNPEGHPSVLSGFKSKEYKGSGFSQLVFDDATGQLRNALQTTQYATQLNLGYLIHHNANWRQAPRGQGFELRTDAWGSLRAGSGLLVTTADRANAAGQHLDTTEATGQLKGSQALQAALSDWAVQHNADAQNAKDPMQHFAQVSEQKIEQQGKSVPGYSEPILILDGQAGIAATSPSHTHIASGEHTSLTSGQDTNLASGKNLAASIHDNLSLIAGNGVKLYGAEGRVDIQAQANTLEGTAKQTMKILSVNSHIDFAAAKSITLICGGAYIKLEGGNIQIHCPGKITIKGAKHSLLGPASMTPAMPTLPRAAMPDTPMKFDIRIVDVPGPSGVPIPYMPWRIVRARDAAHALTSKEVIVRGESDTQGKVALPGADEAALRTAYNETPSGLWLAYAGRVREFIVTREDADWTDHQKVYNAFDAMGYTDHMFTVGGLDADAFHASLARSELRTGAGKKILGKLRGDAS